MLALEVTIEAIEPAARLQRMLSRYGLDSPIVSPDPQSHYMVVAGWLLAQQGVSIQALEVRADGRLIKCANVNVPRPDVVAALGLDQDVDDRIGFHFEIGCLGLPRQFELNVRLRACHAGVVGTESCSLFTIKARKTCRLDMQQEFQPVQLTSLARSGTTLMMQALGQHPEVVITNFYPYEVRQAGYWLHFLNVTAAPADFDASAHPDEFASEKHKVGHNPFNHPEYINQYKSPRTAKEFYTSDTFSALAKFCSERIDAYYRMVAQAEEKPAARLFAEKFKPSASQNTCLDLYPGCREIILTRDFRDVICSAKSFNIKRNRKAFGQQVASNDFEWVDLGFKIEAEKLCKAWRERGSQALHVRYEDLICQPLEQLHRIFSYLGIDSGHNLLESIAARVFSPQSDLAIHSTTSSAQASIGRWKVDMPEDLQVYCNDKLGDALKTFGYEL